MILLLHYKITTAKNQIGIYSYNTWEVSIGRYYRLNRNIIAPEVRLLDDSGKQVGVFTKDKALAKAQQLGVDLVEIAPNAKPPVCKLIDFKKFKYQERKRDRQLRKKERAVELKKIRLRPFIGEHDFKVRTQKAKGFLEAGDRVKISVQFFGRQIKHKEFGYKIFDQLTKELNGTAVQERKPIFQGKKLVAYYSPKKNK